jgi:single-strand DNA-binding protein
LDGSVSAPVIPGKLIPRTWQDDDGNKRQTVEIQVTHVGPDLQFATADVAKAPADSATASAEESG